MFSSYDASFDFSQVAGQLRTALHGSNFAPQLNRRGMVTFDKEYQAMHFSAARTHDWAIWNGAERVIDTHFVFPLFKENPADPENYYFTATDAILKIARDNGSKIFYRLGTSIEHSGEQHFNTVISPDYEKYAEILAGIIRHYVGGWADGFEYSDMIYWEIWNEPDLGPRMWCAGMDEFIRFFVTVLKRLKREFPQLKIGGPALCSYKEELFEKLLNACLAESVAPDFISWHAYNSDPDALIAQPAQARAMLDRLGLTETETCINEWHYILGWEGIQFSASPELYERVLQGPTGLNNIDSALFNLSVLAGWQATSLDMGFYYGATLEGNWGFMDFTRHLTKVYRSMQMFGEFLYRHETRVQSTSLVPHTVYTLGAFSADRKRAGMLVLDYRGQTETLEVEVKGLEDYELVAARILDNGRDLAPVAVQRYGECVILPKAHCGSSAFELMFEKK